MTEILNSEDEMQVRASGNYEIANRELVADGADLRVQVLTLAAGQCVPWHYHSKITDTFVCLEGPMVVETRAPRNDYVLTPGQRCSVPPKTAHYVHGDAQRPCKLLSPRCWCLRFRPGRQLIQPGPIEASATAQAAGVGDQVRCEG